MRRVAPCLALTLLLGWGMGMAASLEEDFPLQGTFRAGPCRIRPLILLKDTGYDDNVFLEEDQKDPKTDFTATVEPGFKLLTLFQDRAALVLEERLDYVWFAESAGERHFNNLFKSQANVYLKRVVFFTDLDLASIRERPNTEIDFRIRRHENKVGVGLEYERERSSLRLRVGTDDYRYSSDEPEGERVEDSLNRTEKRATVTGRKRILPKTTFLLEWEGREIDFDEQVGQAKDSESRRISGGFEFDPTAFIRGSLKFGIENLRPDREQQEGFRGWVGEGKVQYRITGGTDLEVRGRRNIGFTTLAGNVYYLDRSYGGTLVQRVADRVAAEVGTDRGRVDYPEPTRGAEPDEIGFRVDEIRSYFLGASYRFSNQTRMGLRVGIWERDSSFDSQDRRRRTAGVTYTYNF